MPDLDQLLADDADSCRAIDGAPSSFDAAFDRALRTARHRRMRAASVSAAAVAALGAGTALAVHSTSSGHAQDEIRFASYDRVVGAVPGKQDAVYVIGPKDQYTADCTVVPGTSVQILVGGADPSAPSGTDAPAAVVRGNIPPMSHDQPHPPNVTIEYPPSPDMPPGPYYFFTCPTS
jgi:hypothetical protein